MTNDILCSPIQFYHFFQHLWQTYTYLNVTATMILQIHLRCGLMKYAIFQRVKQICPLLDPTGRVRLPTHHLDLLEVSVRKQFGLMGVGGRRVSINECS